MLGIFETPCGTDYVWALAGEVLGDARFDEGITFFDGTKL